MRRYLTLMVERIGLPKGLVTVASEDETIVSVAVWAPPGTFELSPGESLRLLPMMAGVIGVLRFTQVAVVLDEIERARPPEPRWLLTLLATDPERRGQGLASAVLAPTLARCDEEGLRAVCETSQPANLGFYARHGFEPSAEHALEEGGPFTFTLRREPGRSSAPGLGPRGCYPRHA